MHTGPPLVFLLHRLVEVVLQLLHMVGRMVVGVEVGTARGRLVGVSILYS